MTACTSAGRGAQVGRGDDGGAPQRDARHPARSGGAREREEEGKVPAEVPEQREADEDEARRRDDVRRHPRDRNTRRENRNPPPLVPPPGVQRKGREGMQFFKA